MINFLSRECEKIETIRHIVEEYQNTKFESRVAILYEC